MPLNMRNPVPLNAAFLRTTKCSVLFFHIPPTLLYNLLAHPRMREFNYSSVRAIVLAAAPVAPAKFKEAMDVFGP